MRFLTLTFVAALAAAPTLAQNCEMPLRSAFDSPTVINGADVDGARVIYQSSGGVILTAFDAEGQILTPGTPLPRAGSFPSIGGDNVAIHGDRAMIASRTPTGVVVELLDISTPGAPALIGSRTFPGALGVPLRLRDDGLVIALVIAMGQNFIQIIDANDPQLPTIRGILNALITRPRVDDVLYVVASNGRLYAAGVADEQNAPHLGEFMLPLPPGSVRAIASDGPRVALLDTAGRVMIIDASDPADMTLLGQSAPLGLNPGDDAGIELRGDVLYAVSNLAEPPYTRSLFAIDVADPDAASVLAAQALPPDAQSVFDFTDSGVLVVADGLLHFSFVTCPCPADLNGDGIIDFADLNLVIAAFNTTPSDPNYNPNADTNLDKVIDFADLNVILASFNSEC